MNPYEAAARETAPDAGAPLWNTIPERPSGFAKLGRIALWGTVGLLFFAGLRTVLTPQEPAPGPAPAAPGAAGETFPAAAAQATAVRTAYAYLAWDQAAPEARAQALAPLLAAGVEPDMGWDRQGVQTVVTALPGPVMGAAGGRARVRVEAQVRTPADKTARWVALEVPVVVAGGRVVVTGAPALVGTPTGPQAAPDSSPRPGDPAFSAATGPAVETAFAAWARGDAAAVIAPGAAIQPLPAGMQLLQVRSWTADEGAGARRWGTAEITWEIGGGEVAQSYRVQLTRVSAESASRWQVSQITGP
ncbi:hypothetical protein ACIP93_37480 [Streptomyces sp. NPDC088745]|uniref:hypothetical protein n=1 Tax=Streptomyces sp. NPDC088745 TaxID=3365884 RepID=UPI003818FB13